MRGLKLNLVLSIALLGLPSVAYSQAYDGDARNGAAWTQARPAPGRAKRDAFTGTLFTPARPVSPREQEEPSGPKSGFGFVVGYKFIDIADVTFQHDTHPDDQFLPRAGVPGSAGTTVLKNTHWALIGGQYLKKTSSTSLTLDLGLLVGIDPAVRPGHSSHRKKNENDSRPDEQGAFIYTKPTLGLNGAVGFTYDVKNVSLGAEGQLSVVNIESGWDRFGEDEKQGSSTQSILSAGPKLGLWLGPRTRVEGSVQFGRSVNFGASLRYVF